MNLFHKIVMISLCSLSMVSISLHANAIPGAEQYMRKMQAHQIPTPEEVKDFNVVKAIFNIPQREARLQLLQQLKLLMPTEVDSLDRIYTYIYPKDRA